MRHATAAALSTCALLAPVPAAADTVAEVLRVVDGDTVEVSAEVWPDVRVHTLVRVDGVDTPELRGKCEDEKRRAVEAQAFVAATVGTRVRLVDVRHDKYAGRVVARLFLEDGRELARLLIEAGHGRAYDGGTRGGWCASGG